MQILVKTAAAAVVGAVLCLVVKKHSPEHALLLTVAIAAAVVAGALDVVREVSDFIEQMGKSAGMSADAVTVVLKTVAIAILTRLCSGVCKDAGQASAEAAVELAGSVCAVYVALPLMRSMLTMVQSFM